MRPSFPSPPATYVAGFITHVLQAIADRLDASREVGQDVDLSNGERLILKSANGSRWVIGVNDAGVLTAARLP